ncbi:hypothetical protein GSU69_08945 [Rathayibacter festucae]|uniref:Uncharacterized protein n=1 Tax=Rathayibacter festucae TaxID=110937 RepID=A0ABX6GZG1_9MICO|nr:hypothetical protein [Rathayibacter festucae]QHC62795.1 hypothetical protein GSU69_08945 [Rathayibacter festucae]
MRRKAVAVIALVVLAVAAPITAWSVFWENTISSARCTVTEVVDIHARYTPKFEVETTECGTLFLSGGNGASDQWVTEQAQALTPSAGYDFVLKGWSWWTYQRSSVSIASAR